MTRLELRYDLRNPSIAGTSVADRYDAALEQVPGGWVLTVSDLTDTPDLADAITHVQISANATALGVDPADVLADTSLSVVPLEGDDLAAVGR